MVWNYYFISARWLPPLRINKVKVKVKRAASLLSLSTAAKLQQLPHIRDLLRDRFCVQVRVNTHTRSGKCGEIASYPGETGGLPGNNGDHIWEIMATFYITKWQTCSLTSTRRQKQCILIRSLLSANVCTGNKPWQAIDYGQPHFQIYFMTDSFSFYWNKGKTENILIYATNWLCSLD